MKKPKTTNVPNKGKDDESVFEKHKREKDEKKVISVIIPLFTLIFVVVAFTLLLDWFAWETSCERPMRENEIMRTCHQGNLAREVYPSAHVFVGVFAIVIGIKITPK